MMSLKPVLMIPFIVQRLRRVLSPLTWFVLALAGSCSLPAFASSPVGPTVTVAITIGAGYPAILVDTSVPLARREPFYAQGQVVWTEPNLDKTWAAGADIYFGVILPGGTTVDTWSPSSDGTVTLNSGYAPLVRARSVLSTGTFTTESVNAGNRISYNFSGSEAKGLYLVFLFMVPTGADPTDITQWSNVTMQPFFVK